MSIGIIGAGALGSNVARLLAKSGITATIANSRGPSSLAGLVKDIGPTIKAGTTWFNADWRSGLFRRFSESP